MKCFLGHNVPELIRTNCRGFMGEDKNPEGRPSKYQPSFCDVVIQLGKEGASKVEMACALDICKATFYNYEQEYPEFLDAVKKAVMFSQCFWEKQGRIATFGATPNFNATTWIFNMKNRFSEDWKDVSKQENQPLGKDGLPTDQPKIEINMLSHLSAEELQKIIDENSGNA